MPLAFPNTRHGPRKYGEFPDPLRGSVASVPAFAEHDLLSQYGKSKSVQQVCEDGPDQTTIACRFDQKALMEPYFSLSQDKQRATPKGSW